MTAEILARGGRPVAIAEYAIHEAHRIYREATAGTVSRRQLNAARAQRRRALSEALAAFDAGKSAGERETFPIRQARVLLEPLPAEVRAILAQHKRTERDQLERVSAGYL